jgi:hypothetical protein
MWWMAAPDPIAKLPWQPVWPLMKVEDIPPASTLLYYNGNTWTEKEARVKGFPYKDPPFHASFYLGYGKHLNQSAIAQPASLTEEFRSTRRVDVITYPDLSDTDRQKLVEEAFSRVGTIYDIPGFIRFGLPFMKEWHFANFCSEQVAEIFDTEGFRVSIKAPKDTEPFRLWQFASLYPKNVLIRTLHVGAEYPGQKIT